MTIRHLAPALWALLVSSAAASEARAEVRFDQGLTYLGLEGPRELADEAPLELRVHFRASAPLDRRWDLFLHVEGEGGPEGCRFIRDVTLLQDGRDSTAWRPGPVSATVRWPRTPPCRPGELQVWLGLWDPETGVRLAVLDGAGDYDRLRAARLRSVPPGGPVDDAPVAHEPDPTPPPRPAFVPPWTVLGLFGVALLTALLVAIASRRGWPGAALETDVAPAPRRRLSLGALLPYGLYAAGVSCCLGFVKDDAYISFRYARNLVEGRGLVFSAGEAVEGYTNFLWIVLLAPFEALGLDLVQVCDVLGPAFGALLILTTTRAALRLDGRGPAASHLWAACWLASSSSLALWSVGGLEQSLAALLPLLGALLAWRAWESKDSRAAWVSGLALAGACLTRPEGHLFVALIGAMGLSAGLLRRGARARLRPLAWRWMLPLSLVLIPYHLWRWLTFGALMPNTWLVKAVSGPAVARAGFGLAADLLAFGDTGVALALAALSIAVARGRPWRWASLVLALCFVAYEIRVGTDELIWHRLFLPALPFVALGAASSLRVLAGAAARRLPAGARSVPYLLGWAVVLVACWQALLFTDRETQGLRGYAGCSGENHPDLGKFLTRHSPPGALVAFQDMGATPYFAPDLRFLDLVGLVDRRVALLLREHGVHPFVGATRARRGGEHCAALREEVFRRDPAWIVLVPWPSRDRVSDTAERFHRGDPYEVLREAGAFRNTQFDCRLHADPRFRDRWVHVRTWMRSPVYYLSAFQRRDLWRDAPREVLWEGAPPGVSGPRATFDNGVRLLGAEIERSVVVERHEVFVTTWWRTAPGVAEDTWIFLHLEGDGPSPPRAVLDHPPGDWMYPVRRWEPGRVFVDRVLLQLPVGLPPGRYTASTGLFRRHSGQRIGIARGGAPDDRVPIGTLEVRPFRFGRDPLIRRTDPAEQRSRPGGA